MAGSKLWLATLAIIALGATAYGLLQVESVPPQRALESETRSAPQKAATSQTRPAAPSPTSPTTPTTPIVVAARPAKEAPLAPLDDLANLMDMADLRSPETLRHALREIAERTPSEVAMAILSLYRNSPRGDQARRERAMWFAAKRNSPELIPLWQDLLQRTTPLYDDEDTLLRDLTESPHDERTRAIRIERSVAIAGLGGLAAQSADAKSFLHAIVLGTAQDAPQLDQALRFDAARELHANDRLALLHLARELPAQDPLAERLATLANQERARRQTP